MSRNFSFARLIIPCSIYLTMEHNPEQGTPSFPLMCLKCLLVVLIWNYLSNENSHFCCEVLL